MGQVRSADGRLNTEKAIEKLRLNKLAIFKINALTRNGREDLMSLFASTFVAFNLNPEYVFNLFSAVTEIIFNGIKANAKFIVFREELRKVLIHNNTADIDEVLKVILREEPLREFVTRYVMPDKIKYQVNQILKLDEKARRSNLKELDKDEQNALSNFREKLEENTVEMYFTIGITPESIAFTVVNDSPVLTKDMHRLEASRLAHQKLFQEGRSGDFFGPENLDTTESAGFGIGMADEVYYQMGLDPFIFFTITVENNQTTAVLQFPRKNISA